MNRVRTSALRLVTSIAVLFALAAAGNAFGASTWLTGTSSQFTIYTTANRDTVTRLTHAFEAEASVLNAIGLAAHPAGKSLRIVAFADEREFLPYEPKSGAVGFYQPGQDVDYIVLKDVSAQAGQIAQHEYAHYLLKNAYPNLPLWLDEGMADVFSSTEAGEHSFRVGAPLPERLSTLNTLRRVDIRKVFSVEYESAAYSYTEEGRTFYAESWVLAHMLMLSDSYAPQFPSFLARVSSGVPAAEALETTYGKSLAVIEKELDRYRKQKNFPFLDRSMNADSGGEPSVTVPAQMDVELALVDILSLNPYKQPEAAARLSQLAAIYPQNAAVEESLAFLALRNGSDADAKLHIANAIERGSANRELVFRYLAIQAQRPQLTLALSLLPKIEDKIAPQDAYRFFYSLAYCHAHLKDFAQAEAFGAKARSSAVTLAQQERADQLLRFVGTTLAASRPDRASSGSAD